MCKYVLCLVVLLGLWSCAEESHSSIKEFSFEGEHWTTIERTHHIGAITVHQKFLYSIIFRNI